MKNKKESHTLRLVRLRRDIREGLDSDPSRPWSVAEMQRQGRKLLAARKSSK